MIGKKKNVKKNTEPKEYNLIAIGLSISMRQIETW